MMVNQPSWVVVNNGEVNMILIDKWVNVMIVNDGPKICDG